MSSHYEREVFGPRFDPAAVDRIVAAVTAPADIDRQALLDDLENAHAIYRTGEALRSRPGEREELARRIVAAFEQGNALLDKYIRAYGALYLRPYRMRLDSLRKGLADNPVLNKLTGFKQQVTLSAVERFVLELVRIFQRHWRIDAGYTDNPYTGETTGPCVHFIDAALKEVGIHYDRGSISKTMRKLP
jgi:hypothetical protein